VQPDVIDARQGLTHEGPPHPPLATDAGLRLLRVLPPRAGRFPARGQWACCMAMRRTSGLACFAMGTLTSRMPLS